MATIWPTLHSELAPNVEQYQQFEDDENNRMDPTVSEFISFTSEGTSPMLLFLQSCRWLD